MVPGNLVLLNGTPSAGKSSIARALQEIMNDPYVHTGVDHFLPRVPQKFFQISDGTSPARSDYFLLVYKGGAQRATAEVEGGETVFGLGQFTDLRIGSGGVALLAGFYKSVAALAASGVNVVVDDVIHDRRVLSAAVDALRDTSALFVGLHVPREVAEQRERDRGDRGVGAAAAFYDRVHAHAVYDLEIDTSLLNPTGCAQQIKRVLQEGRSGEAIRRLAQMSSDLK